MGLDLKVGKNYWGLSIPYSAFFRLRMNIAEAYDKKFDTNVGSLYVARDWKPFNIPESRTGYSHFGRLTKFMFHSDCEGRMTHKDARKALSVLELIDVEDGNFVELLDTLRTSVRNREDIIFS
ncbi:MAG: hypothetical protein ACRCXT_22170 [Paraclostridium sp.]